SLLFFFFFQAEDGIRDRNVTGVQTCALPIFKRDADDPCRFCLKAPPAGNLFEMGIDLRIIHRLLISKKSTPTDQNSTRLILLHRSEERRVGKESRSE